MIVDKWWLVVGLLGLGLVGKFVVACDLRGLFGRRSASVSDAD